MLFGDEGSIWLLTDIVVVVVVSVGFFAVIVQYGYRDQGH